MLTTSCCGSAIAGCHRTRDFVRRSSVVFSTFCIHSLNPSRDANVMATTAGNTCCFTNVKKVFMQVKLRCGCHAAHPSTNPSRICCVPARPTAHRPFATTVATSPPAPVPPPDLALVERSRAPTPEIIYPPRLRARYSPPRRSDRASQSVQHAGKWHRCRHMLGGFIKLIRAAFTFRARPRHVARILPMIERRQRGPATRRPARPPHPHATPTASRSAQREPSKLA